MYRAEDSTYTHNITDTSLKMGVERVYCGGRFERGKAYYYLNTFIIHKSKMELLEDRLL